MSKFLSLVLVLAAGPLFAEGNLGLGRVALPEEVAAWDTDIRPDGQGLPVGSGDVFTGEEIWIQKCASCHGDFAEGVGRWPVLAGGIGTLESDRPVKTIGSYWPYLSTVYDYVQRAMPFGNASSLTDDEVYALTAYLLYSNNIVDDEFTLSNENFLDVEMPNAGNFYLDDRADVELAQFSADPCMVDCKATVEITKRAAVVDVTPDEDTDSDEVDEASTAAAEVDEPKIVGPDPVLVAAGEKAFKQCKACHQLGEGAKNRTGPILTGVVGNAAGAVEDFRYSKALKSAADDGLVWDEASLAAFLENPKAFLKGTKMSFRGVRKEEDIAALIAYLMSTEN